MQKQKIVSGAEATELLGSGTDAGRDGHKFHSCEAMETYVMGTVARILPKISNRGGILPPL